MAVNFPSIAWSWTYGVTISRRSQWTDKRGRQRTTTRSRTFAWPWSGRKMAP